MCNVSIKSRNYYFQQKVIFARIERFGSYKILIPREGIQTKKLFIRVSALNSMELISTYILHFSFHLYNTICVGTVEILKCWNERDFCEFYIYKRASARFRFSLCENVICFLINPDGKQIHIFLSAEVLLPVRIPISIERVKYNPPKLEFLHNGF